MKNTMIALSLLFVSCGGMSYSSQPITFYAEENHNYFYHIIVGSDSQLVDKAYGDYYNFLITNALLVSGNHTFADSLLVETSLRKYYVTKDLENSIKSYLISNSNNEMTCKGKEKYPDYHYEFTFNNKKDKSFKFCMNDIEVAKTYFKGLKKTIEDSSKDTNQTKLILIDLNALINLKSFHFSIHQKQVLLRNAKTPKEMKEMQKIIDTLEYQDSLDQQELQNN